MDANKGFMCYKYYQKVYISHQFIIAKTFEVIDAVAVFCGSLYGRNENFEKAAALIGSQLALYKKKIVYGGGNKGLMGAVANAALQNNGRIMGVMPELLRSKEHLHTGITDMQIVPDMHTRKRLMYEACDIALILPGGFGTMDELFEMITWNQLHIHDKKIILLNISGYYDALIKHLYVMQQEKFLHSSWQEMIFICNTADDAIAWILENENSI